MAYNGLTIETVVHDTSMSSHSIPAYPEYSSSTTFDKTFYTARRKECDVLVGAAIDYSEPPVPSPPPGKDISDAAISGPSSIEDDGAYNEYTLTGANVADYVDGYIIEWTVPDAQKAIWRYKSDTTDVITVQVQGLDSGSGTITCTFTERADANNTKTITKGITINS